MLKAALTSAEAAAGLKALAPQIENYAELIVRKGVNVREGQEVVVQAPVEARDFAAAVVRKSYEAGAGNVTVIWVDDEVSRLSYEYHDADFFKQVPEWKRVQLESLAEKGACFIFIEGADPSALEGIDPAKPACAAASRNASCPTFRRGMDFNINPWCIAGAPVRAWARQVFPGVDDEVAVYQLWNAILDASRALGEDPESEWELHNARFEKNLRILNESRFDALRLTSKNGTDLTVGLTDRHVWAGGKSQTPDGHPFFPNIPTEEVFTSPDCRRVDGIVHSALPLIHNGAKVDGFWIRFEGGVAVDFDAEQGRDALKSILDLDDGAKRLGEVALISKNTPIRQSGTLFYDTLYDENASCHLALGVGFPECYEGGYDLTADELLERGVNKSHTHVDFMVGTEDMDIVGIRPDGTDEPVFVNGQWAWE